MALSVAASAWNTFIGPFGDGKENRGFLSWLSQGLAAVALAQVIRSLGFVAIPCMNDTTLSVPLAIDAGLGELGRLGYLITPEFGPHVRIAKVLTIQPLVPDPPITFGVPNTAPPAAFVRRSAPRVRSVDRSGQGTFL